MIVIVIVTVIINMYRYSYHMYCFPIVIYLLLMIIIIVVGYTFHSLMCLFLSAEYRILCPEEKDSDPTHHCDTGG